MIAKRRMVGGKIMPTAMNTNLVMVFLSRRHRDPETKRAVRWRTGAGLFFHVVTFGGTSDGWRTEWSTPKIFTNPQITNVHTFVDLWICE